MTRTFWLSFVKVTPEGTEFLGVCVVEVTEADRKSGWHKCIARGMPTSHGRDWIAGAINRTHRLGINPGGNVKFVELPPDHPPVPLDRLLSRAELEQLGIVEPKP